MEAPDGVTMRLSGPPKLILLNFTGFLSSWRRCGIPYRFSSFFQLLMSLVLFVIELEFMSMLPWISQELTLMSPVVVS